MRFSFLELRRQKWRRITVERRTDRKATEGGARPGGRVATGRGGARAAPGERRAGPDRHRPLVAKLAPAAVTTTTISQIYN